MGVVVAAGVARASPSSDAMDKAARLKAEGDAAGATAAYREAVQADPGNALAHNELGTLLFQAGQTAEAIAEFKKATECDPAYALAYYNYAFSSRKAGRFQEAVGAYQRYEKLKPDDPDAKYGLAESLRALGRNAEAVDAYRAYVAQETRPSEQEWVEKAKALILELGGAAQGQASPPRLASPAPAAPAPAAAQPPQASPMTRGDAALAQRRFTDAARAYQEAVQEDPRNALGHFRLGVAYAELNFLPQAIAEWQLVLRIDPQNAGARDNIKRAEARLSAARPAPPAPPATAPAPAQAPAAALSPAPKPATAPATPAAMPTRGPDPAEAGRLARVDYESAVGLIAQRRYADALTALDAAVKLQPDFAVAYVARGSADVGLGRYSDAIREYLKGLSLNGNQASPLFGLGEAYRGLGDRARAAQYYQECAQSTSPDAAAVRDLARKRYADLVR